MIRLSTGGGPGGDAGAFFVDGGALYRAMTDAAPDDEIEARRLTARADALSAEGRAEEAFAVYREAVARDRAHVAAYAGAARILVDRQDFGQAAQLLSRAIEAAGDDGAARGSVAPALADLLSGLEPDGWHPRLDHDLLACLMTPEVEAQRLARVTARVLMLKTPVRDAESLAEMAADPLWIAFLMRCLNVDAEMERRLTAVRRSVLLGTRAPVELVAALALQAFAGEYVWSVEADEAAALETAPLPLSALYRSLAALEPRSEEVDDLTRAGPVSAALTRRTLVDPDREAELARTVEILPGAGADATSEAVRSQYEANPYPRWIAPARRLSGSLREAITRLPRVDAATLPDRPLRVLIAGCGTGYEPIDLKRMDGSLEVTALDLSRASLGYARRMAEALGVEGVRFVQGDLLDAGALGERFDVVISTGVLHHMKRPDDGLRALANVLAPDGVVRLGLYSERARAAVRLAHAEIARLGRGATAEDIRAFRRQVLDLPDDAPLAVVRESEDFWSLSGCRDLLFHVREHRYSLPQVGALLEAAGLRLVGFDAPPEAMAAFRDAFGTGADALDLDLWDRLEGSHPTLFAGMYQVWGQARVEP